MFLGLVHLLQVAAQIATLRKVLSAMLALEWSLTSVLPEVVPQIARLFEDTPAIRVHALKVQLLPLGIWVFHLDGLVPIRGDSFEMLSLVLRVILRRALSLLFLRLWFNFLLPFLFN